MATKTVSLPKVKKVKNPLATKLDELVQLRVAIKKLETTEKIITDEIRLAVENGATVESDMFKAELANPETPSFSYDIAKAFNLLTKVQLVAIASISASKLNALVKKNEILPKVEVSLRVGEPKVKETKLLIKAKEKITAKV